MELLCDNITSNRALMTKLYRVNKFAKRTKSLAIENKKNEAKVHNPNNAQKQNILNKILSDQKYQTVDYFKKITKAELEFVIEHIQDVSIKMSLVGFYGSRYAKKNNDLHL